MTEPHTGDSVGVNSWVDSLSSQERGSQSGDRDISKQGRKANEYLDNFVRHPADRLDQRLHGVSRRWRTDSPAVGFRRDLADFAFCFRTKCGLK